MNGCGWFSAVDEADASMLRAGDRFCFKATLRDTSGEITPLLGGTDVFLLLAVTYVDLIGLRENDCISCYVVARLAVALIGCYGFY